MKYFFFLLTITQLSICSYSQTAEDSVKAVINKMFEAMKNADAGSLKSCFSDSMMLQTIIKNNEGNVLVKNESIKDFIELIGKLTKGAADERIIFETIKVDSDLAIAWTPYNFYYNSQFSHCGVNSFQLVHFPDGWKIQYIIDTRRNQGCSL